METAKLFQNGKKSGGAPAQEVPLEWRKGLCEARGQCGCPAAIQHSMAVAGG